MWIAHYFMWTNLSLHPPNLICEIPVDRRSCDTSVSLEDPPAFSVYIAYLLGSTKREDSSLRRMTAIHRTTGQGLGLCHPVNLGARTFVPPASMSMSEIVSKHGPHLEGIGNWGNGSSVQECYKPAPEQLHPRSAANRLVSRVGAAHSAKNIWAGA